MPRRRRRTGRVRRTDKQNVKVRRVTLICLESAELGRNQKTPKEKEGKDVASVDHMMT